ncbi:hypothetical protein AMTRI_Chr04g187070 [Amborella trichopoda]
MSTGYWSIQSAHGLSVSGLMLLLHFQIALLHLNPLPKAICQTLFPFFILPFDSIFFSSSSTTALPPACMQKCSKLYPRCVESPPPRKHSGRRDHQRRGVCARHVPRGTLRGGSRDGGSIAGGRHPPSGRDSSGGASTAGCRHTSWG